MAFHRKQLQPSPITQSDRQVRNIRAQYELSNGDFPREGKKRGRKKKIKKRIFGRIEKYIVDHSRSTLFIADMVKRRAFGELACSVEAILTLFFFVRRINGCNN